MCVCVCVSVATASSKEAIERFAGCLERVRDWMASNRMKLNEDKTQIIPSKHSDVGPTSGRRHADVVMRPNRRVDALYDVQTTHSGTADG